MVVNGKKSDIVWTNHARDKMRFYHLSMERVRRVLHSPKRTEEGIAPGTIAVMQRAGSIKHPYEIWVMLTKTRNNAEQTRKNAEKFPRKSALVPCKSATKIISAWKYPGITKPRSEITLNLIEREYDEFKKNAVADEDE